MSSAQEARRKCDELLRLAAKTQSLGERSQLISEAVHWNEKAQELQRAREQADRGVLIPSQDDPSQPEAP